MNNVQLVGRVTRDIELKQTQGGKSYCNFSLAVAREFNKEESFRTVSFQKVVKHNELKLQVKISFRTVSFQKVVKRNIFLR